MKRRFFKRGSIRDVQDEAREAIFVRLRDELSTLRDRRVAVRPLRGALRITFMVPADLKGKLFPPCDQKACVKFYEGALVLVAVTYAKKANATVERFTVTPAPGDAGGHECRSEEGVLSADAFVHKMLRPATILAKGGSSMAARASRVEASLARSVARATKKAVAPLLGPLLHQKPGVVSVGVHS
jgi:hypothetical protein